MFVYKHMHRDETVSEEDAELYAMEQLGITIKPLGKHGTYTEEQIEFKSEFIEWYFSGNWVKEKEN